VAACDRSPDRLVVPFATARTVRGLGPNGPRSGRRSGIFPASHRTVRSSGPDGPRPGDRVVFLLLLESRSRPLGGKDLKGLRVDRSPGASPDDVESPRN
jgi:hypothetical protein